MLLLARALIEHSLTINNHSFLFNFYYNDIYHPSTKNIHTQQPSHVWGGKQRKLDQYARKQIYCLHIQRTEITRLNVYRQPMRGLRRYKNIRSKDLGMKMSGWSKGRREKEIHIYDLWGPNFKLCVARNRRSMLITIRAVRRTNKDWLLTSDPIRK